MATINQPSSQAPSSPSTIRELPITDSSFLQKIKYDPATLQLTVTMKNGSEYVHFMVFPATVDQLMQAPSKGKFYGEAIRGKGLSTRTITKTTGEPYRNSAKGPIKHTGRTHGS